jgi:hypothetical protein
MDGCPAGCCVLLACCPQLAGPKSAHPIINTHKRTVVFIA